MVGGAQSAAEMLWATHQQFPQAQCTMVMRSIGLNCYESSRFTNELFYPSFVDEFHNARPEAREQLLREMHRSNYSGLAPGLLEVLYRQIYLDRVTGADRMRMRTMVEITDARMVDGEVEITLTDRKTGDVERMRCDVVLLGTGFAKQMPKLVQGIADSVGVSEVAVDRNYRMQLPRARPGRLLPAGHERGHPRHRRLAAQRAGDPVAGDRAGHPAAPAGARAGHHRPDAELREDRLR